MSEATKDSTPRTAFGLRLCAFRRHNRRDASGLADRRHHTGHPPGSLHVGPWLLVAGLDPLEGYEAHLGWARQLLADYRKEMAAFLQNFPSAERDAVISDNAASNAPREPPGGVVLQSRRVLLRVRVDQVEGHARRSRSLGGGGAGHRTKGPPTLPLTPDPRSTRPAQHAARAAPSPRSILSAKHTQRVTPNLHNRSSDEWEDGRNSSATAPAIRFWSSCVRKLAGTSKASPQLHLYL